MIKCSVFIATSLDGFIARKDGSIDWLEEANKAVPADTDLGYDRFFASIDALVMGRNTFEQVLSFPQWPYGTKPLVVLSRSLTRLPDGVPQSVSLSNEAPEKLVAHMEREGFRHLYVDGGKTIRNFLRAGLIDEMTITIVPVLIGEGLPLFGETGADVHYSLIASQAFDFGFVQNTYRKKP
jgi:dihydrofolate reductase